MVLLLFFKVIEVENWWLGEFDCLEVVLGRILGDGGVGDAVDVAGVLLKFSLVLVDVGGERVLFDIGVIEDVLDSVEHIDEADFGCPLHDLFVFDLAGYFIYKLVPQSPSRVYSGLLDWIVLEEHADLRKFYALMGIGPMFVFLMFIWKRI